MISKLYFPKAPLIGLIDSFYYYTGYHPAHLMDRYLPDGNVTLIFELTDSPKYIYDNITFKEIQTCRKVWFSGIRTVPITIPSGQHSEMVIVNFKKGKSFPFLNDPLNALTNHVVDAELVFGGIILELRQRMMEAVDVQAKFEILEAGLTNLCKFDLGVNEFVTSAVSTILASPNQVSIRDITEDAGYSQKHLIGIFKKCVGVTPKEFLKIIRFQLAIHEIERNNQVSWSDIAFDCGFYDQSHFIADFKKFSGFTPENYIRMKGEQLNYIPVK